MGANGKGATPRILGLTGPIACGKTTVGNLLLELGARERIDADDVVHDLMKPGTPTTAQIETLFGPAVIAPDGSVDRPRLADVVFANQNALRRLEAIVHPAVRQVIRDVIQALSGQDGAIVIDAIRLLQSELPALCDAIWVVQCDPESQLHRLTKTRRMTVEAARARLAAQPSFSHPRVTTVIENSGSLEELRATVSAEWRALMRSWNLAHR